MRTRPDERVISLGLHADDIGQSGAALRADACRVCPLCGAVASQEVRIVLVPLRRGRG